MVLDAAKGIEAQTLKLFEVCRARAIPVLTFINKLDQPSKDPFELMDDIERVLGIAAAPMNWPLGDGPDFRGVYDLEARAVLLYERQRAGLRNEPVAVTDATDRIVTDTIGAERQGALIEAVAMIEGAGTSFDRTAYREGRQTPVFFGSALNDFGVEPFLLALLSLAPSPHARMTETGLVAPTDPHFSGFVFKVQANMNPRHRDRVAFLRICSGRLVKDMPAEHERLGTTIRLSRVYRFFGRGRETVPEAYAGDVVGLVNPGQLAIGDTLYSGTRVRFPPIPLFPPERFAIISPTDTRHKRFDEAVRQLAEEGLLQLFMPQHGPRHPIVGVVGALQFDVIEARLLSEYGIRCRLEPLPHVTARWPVPLAADTPPVRLPTSGVMPVRDRRDRPVLLFQSDWHLRYTTDENPGIRFNELL
jgi:peptide chain release factor 3